MRSQIPATSASPRCVPAVHSWSRALGILQIIIVAGVLLQAVDARPGRPRNPHKAGDRDCHARTLFPRLNPVPALPRQYDLHRLVPS